jgi:ACS family glucarate transporter-like MFS transporter
MTVPEQNPRKTQVRWLIVFMLFLLTAISYADRANISIAAPLIAKDLKLNAIWLGYIFSAFGWSYTIFQIPGGWLLDRFGSKKVYGLALFFWSLCTLLQGFVGLLSIGAAVAALFALRFLIGVAECPTQPANARIAAAWFPTKERGRAGAIFNSGQYFSMVLFSPVMGWIAQRFGWHHIFVFMGGLGLVCSFIWMKVVYSPKEHPYANEAELAYIEQGGALVNMDQKMSGARSNSLQTWWYLKQLLKSRLMMGICIGQFCISALTYFFLTWFPVYLVQARGMSIFKAGFVVALPAFCGFGGGLLGGVISDLLLRRGCSLSVARKTPIIAGLLLSMSMIMCNLTRVNWLVVLIMTISFFGKGIGGMGWVVVSDTAPKQVVGLFGGLFNTFSNVPAITTPIIIGYIVHGTGSFNWALLFVAANALCAVLCYWLVVGEIKRMELQEPDTRKRHALV